ncbi:MAG: NAD-dependent deacetylase [Myxococcota bacterium]
MASSPSDFLLTPALDAEIERAAVVLTAARHTVALTGAGLSVESGIPPFRGPGGLWTKYGEPPMDGYQRFLDDPAGAWRERLHPTTEWAVALVDTLRAAKPNTGHRALAELERLGRCAGVITQNVDDLHAQAGTRNLLEIHGNHRLLRCLQCVRRFEPESLRVDPDRLPPLCPECGGLVKGDTVQFGEPIPQDVLRACYRQVERADCMLVIGTSATVYPAADFPAEVLRRAGSVIEVNGESTEISDIASLSLRGSAGAVLERLLQLVKEAGGRDAT